MQSLLPPNVTLIPQQAAAFKPEQSTVTTTTGGEYTYKYLVTSAGLQINWGDIKGLKEALETPNVSSVYDFALADKVCVVVQGKGFVARVLNNALSFG